MAFDLSNARLQLLIYLTKEWETHWNNHRYAPSSALASPIVISICFALMRLNLPPLSSVPRRFFSSFLLLHVFPGCQLGLNDRFHPAVGLVSTARGKPRMI